MAVTANFFEIIIPVIPVFPWIKIGLANIFVIIALLLYGMRAALIVTFLKTLVGAALCGLPVTSLILSGSGGISSALVMALIWKTMGARKWVGLCGLGMVGALTHNSAQLFVVNLLFIQNRLVYWQLPFMAFLSVFTGCTTGLLSGFLFKYFKTLPVKDKILVLDSPGAISIREITAIFMTLSIIAFVLITENILLLTAVNLVMLASVLFLNIPFKKMMLAVFRFWVLFLFNAIFNLFFTPGLYYETIPWITHEGVHITIFLSLRLLACVVLSMIIMNGNNIEVVTRPLSLLFRDNGIFTTVTISSIKIIPDIIGMTASWLKSVNMQRKGKLVRVRQGLAGAVREVWARLD
jgi:heptaprenyl diphosphate synthase